MDFIIQELDLMGVVKFAAPLSCPTLFADSPGIQWTFSSFNCYEVGPEKKQECIIFEMVFTRNVQSASGTDTVCRILTIQSNKIVKDEGVNYVSIFFPDGINVHRRMTIVVENGTGVAIKVT